MMHKLPGAWSGTDLLDQHGQLWAELSVYVEEEGRVARENAARSQAPERSTRGRPRRRFRGR